MGIEAEESKQRSKFILDGLSADMEYEVAVAAININGTGPHCEWTIGRTMDHELSGWLWKSFIYLSIIIYAFGPYLNMEVKSSSRRARFFNVYLPIIARRSEFENFLWPNYRKLAIKCKRISSFLKSYENKVFKEKGWIFFKETKLLKIRKSSKFDIQCR